MFSIILLFIAGFTVALLGSVYLKEDTHFKYRNSFKRNHTLSIGLYFISAIIFSLALGLFEVDENDGLAKSPILIAGLLWTGGIFVGTYFQLSYGFKKALILFVSGALVYWHATENVEGKVLKTFLLASYIFWVSLETVTYKVRKRRSGVKR